MLSCVRMSNTVKSNKITHISALTNSTEEDTIKVAKKSFPKSSSSSSSSNNNSYNNTTTTTNNNNNNEEECEISLKDSKILMSDMTKELWLYDAVNSMKLILNSIMGRKHFKQFMLQSRSSYDNNLLEFWIQVSELNSCITDEEKYRKAAVLYTWK